MNEQNLFDGKIRDLISRGMGAGGMAFSPFLTAEEAKIAAGICKNAGVAYLLYGGYDGAERKILAVSDLEPELLKDCVPLVLLEIHVSHLDEISNRDVLGALMASGVRRDVLGDIIVRDGVAMVIAAEHIKDYLIDHIKSIGHQTAVLKEANSDFKIPPPRFEEIKMTVASLRLDAVVAAICKCSREQANQLIEGGVVYLNHSQTLKKTKEVSSGDCISVRKKGKWLVDECGDFTKKGRIIMKFKKYI